MDVNKVEIEQKKQQVKEMKAQLTNNITVYKALKLEIAKLDNTAEQLKLSLKEKEDEIDVIDDILRNKELEIEGLEKATGLKAPLGEVLPEPEQKYRAVRGDVVDEMLARIMNETGCLLPVRRLGNGYYMFGTKKIFCKVTASNLLVRVGGGFSSFRDFLQ